MAEVIDDVSITYEEDGTEIVKELDKEILTRGAWATVVFKYQEWDRRREEYSDVRFSIRRYRKVNGEYRQQSKFNISSAKQAKQLIEILNRWAGETAPAA